MAPRIVVFLGPTLPVGEARAMLDAIYLPPAQQADVLSAITRYRPDAIALIDGVFGHSLPVWHKEILYALERGVYVYGASSMGALRAAETEAFGMVGVGEVYRLYASGEIEDDDEVAVAHGGADTGYRSLSEPMVNLRRTFQQARAEGVMDETDCARLIAIAKGLHFPERTFPTIFRRAEEEIDAATVERMARFCATNYVDVKRQDARLLLETLRDLPEPLPPPPPFQMARSPLFEALYQRDRNVRHGEVDLPLHTIADYTALHVEDFPALSFHAMTRGVVTALAGILGFEVDTDAVEAEERRFRVRRRLEDDAAFAGWLERNDLTPEECRTLLSELALCRRLHRWLVMRKHPTRTTKVLLDELRLEGRYESVAGAAALRERVLREHAPDLRTAGQEAGGVDELFDAYVARTGRSEGISAEAWAEEAGFGSLQELRVELLRERVVRRAQARAARALQGLLGPETLTEGQEDTTQGR